MVRLAATKYDLLQRRGWLTLACTSSDEMHEIADELGRPMASRPAGPIVDRLVPTRPQDAHRRSLSALYGQGSFPFHTDLAHLRTPPRYVLLRLAEGSEPDRPTLYHDALAFPFSDEEKQVLHRDVWLVNGGLGRFLTALLDDSHLHGRVLVRYDTGCMRPAHPGFVRSGQILDRYCRDVQPQSMRWIRGQVLVLDNWRMLHARGESESVETEHRVLERMQVIAREEARPT